MKTAFRHSPRRCLELFKPALLLVLLLGFRAFADSSPTPAPADSSPTPTPAAATPAPAATTHFSYSAPTADSVGLAGEFNSWKATPMTKGTDGIWTADVPLSGGQYGYKFVVNGNDWEFDPNNTARKTVDGIENSSITVPGSSDASTTPAPAPASAPDASGTGVTFSYNNANAGSVFIAGGFNNWSTSATPMTKDATGLWSVQVPLTSGTYQYKLFVDGNWMLDPANSNQADDGTGNQNSVIVVGAAPAPSVTPDTSSTAATTSTAPAPAASPAASGS